MRIFVVDSFTESPFRGNPAGVCLLDAWPAEESWMQRVAAEMRHAETAFVRPVPPPVPPSGDAGAEAGADFELRWFTPAAEVALCGHATLAAAHVLFQTGAMPEARPIRFQTRRSGVLTVRHRGEAGLEMDFPAQPARPTDGPPGLAEALGAPVLWAGRNAQSDVLALLTDDRAVRGLTPDLGALARIEGRGVCVTAAAPVRAAVAAGAAAAPGSGVGVGSGVGAPGSGGAGSAAGSLGYDFVSRFFGPRVGVPEDPVTGSAHCMLAPYWSERLGRTELVGYQASERGGFVRVAVAGDRVRLAGHAVTVLAGDLLV